MDTHARALYGMPSSLFRTERLSRLHVETQVRVSGVLRANDRFLPGRICVSYGDVRWAICAQEKSPQTFSRSLAHQEQVTRRDVAPMVAHVCSYIDVF